MLKTIIYVLKKTHFYSYIKKKDVLCPVFDLYRQTPGNISEKSGIMKIEYPEKRILRAVCVLMEFGKPYRDEIRFMDLAFRFLLKKNPGVC